MNICTLRTSSSLSSLHRRDRRSCTPRTNPNGRCLRRNCANHFWHTRPADAWRAYPMKRVLCACTKPTVCCLRAACNAYLCGGRRVKFSDHSSHSSTSMVQVHPTCGAQRVTSRVHRTTKTVKWRRCLVLASARRMGRDDRRGRNLLRVISSI